MNPFISQTVQAALAQPVSHFKGLTTEDAHAESLTNVAFILDRSGSMGRGIKATVEGYNEQVRAVLKGAEDVGRTTYTSVQFASTVDVVCVAGFMDEIGFLTEESYSPAGNTALLDAIGSTIAAMLDTPHIHSAGTGNLVTVFTDGEENASRIYTAAMIKGLIERLEATDHWTFALIGPQKTVGDLAESLAIQEGNTLGYDETSVADKRQAFSRAASAAEMAFSRKKAGHNKAEDLFR